MVAQAQALHPLQGERPVGAGFAGADPQRLLHRPAHLFGTAQPAGQVPAQADQVLAEGGGGEHGIEGQDLAHPFGGDPQRGGQRGDQALGHPAQTRLHPVEGLDEDAGSVGRPAAQGGDLVLEELGQGFAAHRSNSPPIMFTLPKVAMRSATMWPGRISSSAAMMTKQGECTRTRWGRPVPLLTT